MTGISTAKLAVLPVTLIGCIIGFSISGVFGFSFGGRIMAVSTNDHMRTGLKITRSQPQARSSCPSSIKHAPCKTLLTGDRHGLHFEQITSTWPEMA